jgi:PAS domain S-box-containing protein
VEQSTDGILVLDGAGVVQLWSSAMTDLTGIGPEDAVGRAGTSLLADADSPAPVPLPVSPQCPTAVIEITLSRPDGERRRLRCAHSAVFSGAHMTRDVVLIHDLTLEHEIQRLKSDFIATVSHELRTPLTPIKGYVTLLRTRGDRMTEQKRQDCLNLIADRTDHLARLVEDLLLASRRTPARGVAGHARHP